MNQSDTTDTTFRVSGLNCSGCVGTLTRKALAIYGVVHIDVDLDPGRESRVLVRHAGNVEPELIGAALANAGYQVVAG
jgi:copper chaperone CopZ